MVNINDLIDCLPQTGTVKWIGIRPAILAPMIGLEKVDASIAGGLLNDHYSGRDKKRQVTLIQWEHLISIASLLSTTDIKPEALRRNIVVAGINLLALKDKQFQVGNVVLEYTGHCHPCSRMEKTLGAGGYNAVRGHGGITARIIKEGTIYLEDKVFVPVQ